MKLLYHLQFTCRQILYLFVSDGYKLRQLQKALAALTPEDVQELKNRLNLPEP